MASRKPPQRVEAPTLDPATASRLIGIQIEKGKALAAAPSLSSDAYDTWKLVTRNHIEKAFGTNSSNVHSFTDVSAVSGLAMGMTESDFEEMRRDALATQLARLEGLVELLATDVQLASGSPPTFAHDPSGRKIFLVHGHDEAVLHEVARFLQQLEQDVLVLREQPNSGRTIIEKFEDHADVAFAVVLLTPDDRAGSRNQPFTEQTYRARQNVILELGYFIGRLGRNRVCALFKGELDMPSDYSGVLFVRFDDSGGWRLLLAKEMKAAGLPVDMNHAL